MQNRECRRWSVNEKGRDGGSEKEREGERESDESFHLLESCFWKRQREASTWISMYVCIHSNEVMRVFHTSVFYSNN